MEKHVVILGAGFAGMAAAQALERRGSPEFAVTVVNHTNYLLFTPMLPEVSSGSIEPRHIAQPLRSALRGTSFEMGDVRGVDFAKRTVELWQPLVQETRTLNFDELVLALGAETSTRGTPGAGDHTFALKTLDDAIALREQTIRTLEVAVRTGDDAERRALLTFVVVGGGFTGVEAAGELLGYLRAISRFYPRIASGDVRVVLVNGGNQLLAQLPQRFGDRACKLLTRRGIEVVLDDDVASVDAGGLTLKSGLRFDSRTVVWSAGVRPNSLIETLDLPRSKHHAVVVNADFSVPDRPHVWAIGDCAQIPQSGGRFAPQTAQSAVREGPQLARNIVASLRGKPTRPFRYRSLGMMASLGDRQGLADIAPGVMLSGFPAWFLWRAYYLSQLPGAQRKTRVALDWALSLPFPQDIASIQ